MASKRLVLALLVAANLLAFAAVFFFLRPCPIPSAEGGGDSAAAPSPDPDDGSCDPVLICLPFSSYVLRWVAFVLGCLARLATSTIYKHFAGDDQASTAAKKAGYVAIRDNPENGGADGKD